jgi:hypothetical protein
VSFLTLAIAMMLTRIDILFIHIHISIHLGADLTVWGPDAFGGYAWVDFWFFGFGIDFGDAEKDISAARSLEDFYKQVITAGPASMPPTNDKVGTRVTIDQHKYSVEDGLIPAKTPDADADKSFPSTGAQSVWQVKAGTVKFRIDTPFALSGAYFVLSDPKDDTEILIPSADQTPQKSTPPYLKSTRGRCTANQGTPSNPSSKSQSSKSTILTTQYYSMASGENSSSKQPQYPSGQRTDTTGAWIPSSSTNRATFVMRTTAPSTSY